MSFNPFDDDNGFFVLVNDEEQHGLRPTSADFPAGGREVDGESDGVTYLDCIERNWPEKRPKSLRAKLAMGGVSDN